MCNLKSCPFCGKSDKLELCGPIEENNRCITCWNCNFDGAGFDSDQKAIDWWNNRHPKSIIELAEKHNIDLSKVKKQTVFYFD